MRRLVLLANPTTNTYRYINSLIYSIAIYSRKRIKDSKDLYSTPVLKVRCVALALLKISVACLSLRKLPSH